MGELIDASLFDVAHEEADARMMLHCTKSSVDTIVVSARDTDVLLLLIAHAPHISCTNLWMMSGRYNITAIYENLPVGSTEALLSFYVLTDCNTTSFIYKHSKTSAWKIFLDHHELLSSIGEGVLTKLPPTSDAFSLHTLHDNYQTLGWKQTHCLEPLPLDPVTMGWKKQMITKLRPVLMIQDLIPKACAEIFALVVQLVDVIARRQACSAQVFVGARKLLTQTDVKIPTLKQLKTIKISFCVSE